MNFGVFGSARYNNVQEPECTPLVICQIPHYLIIPGFLTTKSTSPADFVTLFISTFKQEQTAPHLPSAALLTYDV